MASACSSFYNFTIKSMPRYLYFFPVPSHQLFPSTFLISRAYVHSKPTQRGSIQPAFAREKNALADRSRRLRRSVRVLEGASGTSEHPESPMPFDRAQSLADDRKLQLVEVLIHRTFHYGHIAIKFSVYYSLYDRWTRTASRLCTGLWRQRPRASCAAPSGLWRVPRRRARRMTRTSLRTEGRAPARVRAARGLSRSVSRSPSRSTTFRGASNALARCSRKDTRYVVL